MPVLVNYEKKKSKVKRSKRDSMVNEAQWVEHKEKQRLGGSFNKMGGRNLDKDALPCFMKNINTRISLNNISAKSLQLNNFSEAKFVNTENGFFPKKSFNKLINLNLLNSPNFNKSQGIQMTPKSSKLAYYSRAIKRQKLR